MDKVLIVDSDVEFLTQVQNDMEKLQHFDVLTAEDGDAAISTLGAKRIAVVASNIETANLEALDLLSHMSHKHPNTPCIVMSDRGKPWFRHRQSQQSFIYHLGKPFDVSALVSALFVALNLRDEGASAEGMTIPSLLPLIEMQQKTCRMQIRSGNKRIGYLYFENGDIIDAHYGKLSGEAAAREIATWNRITFTVSHLPKHRTRRRVKTKLMQLAGATWEGSGKTGASIPAQKEAAQEEAVIFLDDEVVGAAAAGESKDTMLQQKQAARAYLDSILAEIKHIQGYQAIAVVDVDGRVLAAEQKSETLDLSKLAGAMAGFLEKTRDCLGEADYETAQAATLHTGNGILVIQQLNGRSAAPLCAIVACPPRSNWYYFKSRLENLCHTAKSAVEK